MVRGKFELGDIVENSDAYYWGTFKGVVLKIYPKGSKKTYRGMRNRLYEVEYSWEDEEILRRKCFIARKLKLVAKHGPDAFLIQQYLAIKNMLK